MLNLVFGTGSSNLAINPRVGFETHDGNRNSLLCIFPYIITKLESSKGQYPVYITNKIIPHDHAFAFAPSYPSFAFPTISGVAKAGVPHEVWSNRILVSYVSFNGGESKVGYLDIFLLIEEEILGLHVAVCDAVLVAVLESGDKLVEVF